jgi:hypothetical protein
MHRMLRNTSYEMHHMVWKASHGMKCIAWYKMHRMVQNASHGTKYITWYEMHLMVGNVSHGMKCIVCYKMFRKMRWVGVLKIHRNIKVMPEANQSSKSYKLFRSLWSQSIAVTSNTLNIEVIKNELRKSVNGRSTELSKLLCDIFVKCIILGGPHNN